MAHIFKFNPISTNILKAGAIVTELIPVDDDIKAHFAA
ncbi:DUF1293 family protein [Vibrio vulnificus]